MTETTVDTLLGGRFEVEQPAKGYRIAVDTLLLAAAVQALEGDRVCELGCGVGGVMLALATRLPRVHVTGIELQQSMVDLCESNIRRNHLQDRLSVTLGDVARLADELHGAFDHLMMNPPYHDHKSHTVSANNSKRLAHAESDEADLTVWIKQASLCLKDNGVLWLIHRADRLDEITEIALCHFSGVVVKPIIAREGSAPKRVIVRADKSGDSKRIDTLAPFILYGDDNRYNDGAEDVLRHAQPLLF